jgi:hypothetical protein
MELVLKNCNVLLPGKNYLVPGSIVVKKGVIQRVIPQAEFNDIDPSIYSEDRVIDLEGKPVLPGFIDSHVHMVQTGLNLLGIDLSGCTSVNQILEMVREAAKDCGEGQIIRGLKIEEGRIKERRFPNRWELDRAAPDRIVWLNRVEYHISSVNSYAFHMLKLPFNIKGIEKNGGGLPTGVLRGQANFLARKKFLGMIPDDLRSRGVDMVAERALTMGVTTINAMEGGVVFHDRDADFIHSYAGKLPLDVELFYQTTDVKKVARMNLNRVGGCVFLDGSFGSRTAALFDSYSDSPNTLGILYFTQEEIDAFIAEAHCRNMQCTVHAIGPRAIEQILNSYEKVLAKYPVKGHIHRIEHFELPTESQLERAASLGIILSMQPTYEVYWGGAGGMYERRLGKERCKATNPFRKIIDKGCIIAGGSDSDVTEINPVLGIYGAVNHPTPEFRITVKEAIDMFTVNGAVATGQDREKGTIEEGKKADLVVLDRDPFNVRQEDLITLKVEMTIKDGEIVYRDNG